MANVKYPNITTEIQGYALLGSFKEQLTLPGPKSGKLGAMNKSCVIYLEPRHVEKLSPVDSF